MPIPLRRSSRESPCIPLQKSGRFNPIAGSRDVSSTDSDLFGRAAAKVMNDLFSREELSEVYGRDFDGDLTWRDVTELVERESIDMSEVEGLAARAAAPQQAPDEPEPKPKGETKPKGHSVFGQVL